MHSLRLPVLAITALAGGWLVLGITTSMVILGMLTQALIYAVFALGVGILLRQNGLVSFGHALYFGGAGYAIGVLLALDAVPAEWALLLVPLGAGIVAFLIGLVIVRVPGIAFGMLTLAIGQMAYLLASRSRGITGGADGMSIAWPDTLFGVSISTLLTPGALFMTAWVTLVIVALVLYLIQQTQFGAITEAVRDNAERAGFIGIRTTLPRALVYALSAVVTAIGGLLSALNTGFVSPESLHWSVSAITLLMVIVGGFRTVLGPIVGAVVYFVVKDLLGQYATYSLALFGTVLIIVIVFLPHGLTSLSGVVSKRLRSVRSTGHGNH
ncbi:MAG: branched-chain amino acid ABC transporter permease [Burkholderiaceae bacterium]|jgi:branched-chain amino acid transport system permease protein